MLKAIWRFIKALGASAYHNTLAPIKRWIVNSKDGKADDIDKRTASRVLMYLGLMVLAYWCPQLAIVIMILRNLVFNDILGMVASTLVDAINTCAKTEAAATQ